MHGACSALAWQGVTAFADALLVIPKILSENSGFDAMDALIKLQVCLACVPVRFS